MNSVTLQRIEDLPYGFHSVDVLPFTRGRPSRGTPGERIEDGQFLLMESSFGKTGGLATADGAVRLMRKFADQPLSRLAHWIVCRTIVSFEWRTQTLVPLFQFNASDMSLRSEILMIVRELAGAFDNWDTALWFAQPNVWLNDKAPIDIVASDPFAVLEAARADRFIARG